MPSPSSAWRDRIEEMSRERERPGASEQGAATRAGRPPSQPASCTDVAPPGSARPWANEARIPVRTSPVPPWRALAAPRRSGPRPGEATIVSGPLRSTTACSAAGDRAAAQPVQHLGESVPRSRGYPVGVSTVGPPDGLEAGRRRRRRLELRRSRSSRKSASRRAIRRARGPAARRRLRHAPRGRLVRHPIFTGSRASVSTTARGLLRGPRASRTPRPHGVRQRRTARGAVIPGWPPTTSIMEPSVLRIAPRAAGDEPDTPPSRGGAPSALLRDRCRRRRPASGPAGRDDEPELARGT